MSRERDRALASRARDAAMGRIGRTRRWLLVGAVALSGALTGLASALLPGKSLGASSRLRSAEKTGSSSSATGSARRSRTTSSQSTPALAPPASAAQLGISGTGQAQTPPTVSAPPPTTTQSAPAPSSSAGGAAVSGGS